MPFKPLHVHAVVLPVIDIRAADQARGLQQAQPRLEHIDLLSIRFPRLPRLPRLDPSTTQPTHLLRGECAELRAPAKEVPVLPHVGHDAVEVEEAIVVAGVDEDVRPAEVAVREVMRMKIL